MRILLTGASGFIGKPLSFELLKYNFFIRSVFRKLDKKEKILNPNQEYIFIDDINRYTNWIPFLNNIDCVIHCAARSHIINDKSSEPLEAYRRINLYGTTNLAEQAARAGVKRFIFLSSIGVNGDNTKKFNRF
jgi:nucleoside-diphosphate-sugar epimerase